jgi:hypothetical protein
MEVIFVLCSTFELPRNNSYNCGAAPSWDTNDEYGLALTAAGHYPDDAKACRRSLVPHAASTSCLLCQEDTRMDYLSAQTDFSMLSPGDLIIARDQFHLHLIHKPNVIGTAVGRYRIRKPDPWPDKNHPHDIHPAHGSKTAENVAEFRGAGVLVACDLGIRQAMGGSG